MTAEEQRDELLMAARRYIEAVNNHVATSEFPDILAAREQLRRVVFEVEGQIRGTCGGPMTEKKLKPEDAFPPVKARSPLFIVVCKDGNPHPKLEVSFTMEEACAPFALVGGGTDALKCGPHRVQAYRPMT